jgi:hypothetical protein
VVRVLEGSDRMRVVTTVGVGSAIAKFAGSRGVGFTTDYDAVLLDGSIDAVIFCTPHAQHTDEGGGRGHHEHRHLFTHRIPGDGPRAVRVPGSRNVSSIMTRHTEVPLRFCLDWTRASSRMMTVSERSERGCNVEDRGRT